jgi:hypothetical protein
MVVSIVMVPVERLCGRGAWVSTIVRARFSLEPVFAWRADGLPGGLADGTTAERWLPGTRGRRLGGRTVGRKGRLIFL